MLKLQDVPVSLVSLPIMDREHLAQTRWTGSRKEDGM
jgi:hypothetical protein